MNGPYVAHFQDRDLERLEARPDMAAQLANEGGGLPVGPAWTLHHRGRVLAIWGFERQPEAVGRGWLICANLTPRQWGLVLSFGATTLNRIRGWRTLRTLIALADARVPGARRMLERLGFDWRGDEDGDAVMVLDLRS